MVCPAAAVGDAPGSPTPVSPGVRGRRALPVAVRRALPHLPQTGRHAHPVPARRATPHLPRVRHRRHLLHIRKPFYEVGFKFR